MRPDRFARLRDVVVQAAGLPEDERRAYLDDACRDDPELRHEVESILAHDGQSPGVLRAVGAIREDTTDRYTADLSPEASTDDRIIGRTISHYRIQAKLGEGGMGVVYQAADLKLHRMVALKFLAANALGGEDATKRFLREARTAASLNHPNICTIYEVGEVQPAEGENAAALLPGTPFIAMEQIEGRPVADLIVGSDPMPLDQLLSIAVQVAQGLAAAHARGIVHRDLKPGNVMVSDDGRAKILDFGLAKPVGAEGPVVDSTVQAETSSDELTRRGVVVGTVAYMSPEQAAGKPVDRRSDIFSFGTMLYEMATGQRAFRGDTSTATRTKILETEPRPVSELRRDFPAELEWIIRRCMEKDPKARYQDSRDLVRALDGVQGDLAGSAASHGPSPGRGELRRAGLLVSVILILAVSVAWWWLARQQSATREDIQATRLTALGSGPGHLRAALSPDGRQLAYACSGDLNLLSLDSGESRTLVRKDERGATVYGVTWHPDGKRLLSQESHAEEGHQIWLIDIASNGRELAYRSSESTGQVALSPNGRHLALLRDRGKQLGIVPIGTADFQLLRKADGEVLGWPAWSPDGTRLAYGVTSLQARSRGKEERSDLETCDLLGKRTVVDEGIPLDTYEGVTGLCWLPDGRLVHSRWNDPSLSSGEFWTVGVNPKSGEVKEPPRRLFGIEGGTLRSPTASADGKRLAFTCMRQHRRLWLMELGESGPGGPELRRLSVADWPAEAGVWSRDGQKFLFQSVRRSKQNDIFVLDLKTNREEPLVADSRNELPQCLTPDGSHLLYWRGSDPMELMAIPVTGGEAKRLGEREGNMPPALRCAEGPGSPCISAELQESELVLARLGLDGRGAKEILRIDLATESDRPVAGTELWNVGFDLSADGKRAVVTEFDGRIRIIDVESYEIQELPRMWDGWTQSVSWSRDAAWLYVSGMEGGFKYWLRRFNLRGESEILWKSNEMWAHGPVPSPDGKFLAFEGLEREADVWMIEDF